MLLINKATSPDNTVYFISATINGILNQKDGNCQIFCVNRFFS